MKSRSSPPGKPATRDLFVDRPISSAQEDLLGRSGFAQTLATAILAWRGDDSLTIAVSGDWGSGKTSLKNMLLERLREYGSESPEIVEFNPWKWSTQDKISSAFFREISIALNKVDKSAEGKKRVRRWQRYGRLLTFGSETVTEFSNAIPALLALATIFGLLAAFVPDGTAAEIGKTLAVALAALVAFLKFVGGLATKFAAFLNGNLNDLDEISLEERKTELKEDLLKLPKPVLVVIDDMDRITKEETRLLLQHVKANADFPKMVYLLLYHEEMVANHFAEPSLSGKEFLEKIVQLPFDIPAISQSRVQQVLFAGLDKTLNTLDHIQLDQRRWGNLFAGALSPFFVNLRSVNRFLSTLSVHVSLFQSARAFEVNIVDLIGIETVRVFEPGVYRRIASSKGLLTSGVQSVKGAANSGEVQAIIDAATEEHRDYVRELLKQLFPPIESAFGGPHYASEFNQSWRDELRVCSAAVFDRYFQMGIPEGDLSESEFRQMLDLTGERELFLGKFEEIRARGLLDVMLSRLDGYAPKLDLANALAFVASLMDVGEDLPDSSGFGLGADIHVLRIIVRYLGQEPTVRNFSRGFTEFWWDRGIRSRNLQRGRVSL